MLTLAVLLCMGCGNKEAGNETQIDTECIAEMPTEQPAELVEKNTEKVAEEIGVQNSLRFSANAEETDAMFAKERKSRSKFYRKMCCEMASPMVESNDYFADDEPKTTQAPEPKKGGLMDRLFGKK